MVTLMRFMDLDPCQHNTQGTAGTTTHGVGYTAALVDAGANWEGDGAWGDGLIAAEDVDFPAGLVAYP